MRTLEKSRSMEDIFILLHTWQDKHPYDPHLEESSFWLAAFILDEIRKGSSESIRHLADRITTDKNLEEKGWKWHPLDKKAAIRAAASICWNLDGQERCVAKWEIRPSFLSWESTQDFLAGFSLEVPIPADILELKCGSFQVQALLDRYSDGRHVYIPFRGGDPCPGRSLYTAFGAWLARLGYTKTETEETEKALA